MDLSRVCKQDDSVRNPEGNPVIEVPVTQVVVYGWYDNEFGSYTNMLCESTVEIARGMI